MPVHNPLDSCEANAGSLEISRAMETLKDSEQFIVIFHVKADTVVPDIIHDFVSSGVAPRFNMCCILVFREFDGVGKKVDVDLFNERPVSVAWEDAVDCQRHIPLRVCVLHFFPYIPDKGVHVQQCKRNMLLAKA